MNTEIKIIHRKYPDSKWEYKAISARVSDLNYRKNDVIFYTLSDHGKKSRGVEIYTGSNYIVGSSNRSYSMKYSVSSVPSKYKQIVNELIKIHRSTSWSKGHYVNLN
jgi:hypothetical protein